MNPQPIERLKQRARVAAGACLHAAGLYRQLLPVFRRDARAPLRRLQSYLQHYYNQADSAEAELYLPDLDVTVACDIKDHMLWPHLEGNAPIYEQQEIRHCRGLVRPGDHILDIGANHGFWGFSLARAAGAATLYLAEASPSLQRRLRRTAKLNPQLHARVLPYAIADGGRTQVTFYTPTGNLSGLGSTVLHESARSNGYLRADQHITVAAKSVDALVAEGAIAGIDMMKIDIEQAEDAAICGATGALSRFRPRLLMIETSASSFAAEVVRGMGYSQYRLDAQAQRVEAEPDFWGNVFFVRDP